MEEKAPGLLETILRDHWHRVDARMSRGLPPPGAAAVRADVEKVLRCRTLANGFVRYRCLACEAFHTVCFSCKSRCCPTCGKARAAQAATHAQGRLLNVRHRHLTFTVPTELRPLLFHDRCLLNTVARAAAQATLKAVATRCPRYPPLPGVMATVHTFGRDLSFHVHVHVLCTEGGLRADHVVQPVNLFPIAPYRKLWQYSLLTGLRRKLKGDRGAQRLIGRLFRRYPRGFIVNVVSPYANGRKASPYCCRYTGRPPLSERRISAYDGQQVTFTYQDYRDGQAKTLTLPAGEVLLPSLHHVRPPSHPDLHSSAPSQPTPP